VGNDFSHVDQIAMVDGSVVETALRLEGNVMPGPLAPRSPRGQTLAID